MINITSIKSLPRHKMALTGLIMMIACFSISQAADLADISNQESSSMSTQQMFSVKQQAIPPIAAFMAVGDLPKLNAALNQGLDAGLTVSEVKEILVQLYAYAGFPRCLNALGELMKVLDERKKRGIQDAQGREPSRPAPTGAELLAKGTDNQTAVSGRSVQGPLFDFAPVINQFLRTHLFGDIFERDNLDWQSRELATVGALAAMPGLGPQLQGHIGASFSVGLTTPQLRQLIQVLAERVNEEAANRASAALDKYLAGVPR